LLRYRGSAPETAGREGPVTITAEGFPGPPPVASFAVGFRKYFPGTKGATPCDGATMAGRSRDSGRPREADGSTKENLVAEGIATAVAVAILATVAFFLFRG